MFFINPPSINTGPKYWLSNLSCTQSGYYALIFMGIQTSNLMLQPTKTDDIRNGFVEISYQLLI